MPKAIGRGIGHRIHRFDMDPAALLATCQSKQTRKGYVQVAVNHLQLAGFEGESKISTENLQLRRHARSQDRTERSLRRAEVLLAEFCFEIVRFLRFVGKLS